VAGDWTATKRPIVTGTAQLRAVHAQVHGLNAPLEIRNANLLLTKDFVRVQNLSAAAADAQWRGSIVIPRPCPTPQDCTLQFSLHSSEVSATSLNNLLNPGARKQSWYRFLSLGDRAVPYLLQAQATGKISIDRLRLGTSAVSQISGDLHLDEGRVFVNNLRASALGGAVTAEWNADFSAHPPIYKGRGTIDGVSLSQLADLTGDSWIDGIGSATYQFKTAGKTVEDLVTAANFSTDFAIRDATFSHIVLGTKSGALRASLFFGRVALQEGEFSFQDTKLESATGVYKISGTASLTGALNLKLASEGAIGYDLSGTFVKTHVSQVASTATRASLKP
jgi:AsmA-like protein